MLHCRRGDKRFIGLLGYRYAHRGLHNKPRIPENSLAAFRHALECGYGAELDVHLLADGSLVVFHDHDLMRCTGCEGKIEDLSRDTIVDLRLEGTEEKIPFFDDVLTLFEGKAPLIIELKSTDKNRRALVETVCRRLDSYKGSYCIETFDPFTLKEVKVFRPDICRGQLSMNFCKKGNGEHLAWYERFIAAHLLLNFLTTPDFISYRFSDRKLPAVQICRYLWGAKEAAWTVIGEDELIRCEAEGCIPIFEERKTST